MFPNGENGHSLYWILTGNSGACHASKSMGTMARLQTSGYIHIPLVYVSMPWATPNPSAYGVLCCVRRFKRNDFPLR